MTTTLIRRTAKLMAGEFYEAHRLDPACSDTFKQTFPNVKKYVRLQWPNFLVDARHVLTRMLSMPHVPEPQKQEIYDALLVDKAHIAKQNGHFKYEIVQEVLDQTDGD